MYMFDDFLRYHIVIHQSTTVNYILHMEAIEITDCMLLGCLLVYMFKTLCNMLTR